MPNIKLDGIEKEIEEVLLDYVKINSNTGTRLELAAERFLMEYFQEIPYFAEHKENYGAYRIPGDLLDRAVCWGMVKGEGSDTVVLIHHYDVVDIEDFKHLKPLAYSPVELAEALSGMATNFSDEIQKDLKSGRFLFGRGTADMKAGGAIQLALLKRYSALSNQKGNLLLIAVPDEENLSSGMRGAAGLLDELKETYGLHYLMMINSEPHLRKHPEVGVFSEGSVGKLMPFVYVRGYLSHIGKVFEGFNPVNLLSEIVCRTELNMEFSDAVQGEASPPPTWLYMKDGKKQYDVSLPISAFGCLSVLTLNKTPAMVMERLNDICLAAFETVIEQMNQSWNAYQRGIGEAETRLCWKPSVVSFRSLYQEAEENYGQRFRDSYNGMLEQIRGEISEGRITMLDGNCMLVETVYNFIDDLSPRVVTGLTPPYYPNVSNLFFENMDKRAQSLSQALKEHTVSAFGQDYTTEQFFMGISDMSYTYVKAGTGTAIRAALLNNMPFFGNLYDLPISEIERISMPCINIGPWGKDFHKLTERVCIDDVMRVTPELLQLAIAHLLS